MLYSDFQKKVVINIRDCKNLGHITDLEFDKCSGQISKIIIKGSNKLCNLFICEPEYVICYRDIKQIGEDIILVDV